MGAGMKMLSRIADFFTRSEAEHRSKHQVHQRKHVKGRRRNMRADLMRASVSPAGSKLAKRFAKANRRGPRGF